MMRPASGLMRRAARATVLATGFGASIAAGAPVGAAQTQTVSDLAVVESYEQREFRDAGRGLRARYIAVDAPDGERREINVVQIPLGAQSGGAATAGLLTEMAEEFRIRAEQDCAKAESRTLATPKAAAEEATAAVAATAVEIVCEGFGAARDGDSYLYARFEALRSSVVVISYQWRSDRAAAASVRASDLRRREVEPRVAEIRRDLDARLSD